MLRSQITTATNWVLATNNYWLTLEKWTTLTLAALSRLAVSLSMTAIRLLVGTHHYWAAAFQLTDHVELGNTGGTVVAIR